MTLLPKQDSLRRGGPATLRLVPKRHGRLRGKRLCACGTIRTFSQSGCLDRLIPIGEWHLRRTLTGYVAHYQTTRGLDNELIDRLERQRADGPVRRREHPGGSSKLLLPAGDIAG